jgi:DNA-binding SARP family transcriptional activator
MPEDRASDLLLSLLGGFRLRAGGAELALPPKKARALLAYLALHAGRPLPRGALAALLWPEAAEEPARASLRQALASIRRALGERASRVLDADAEQVVLFGVAADALDFERLAGASDPTALESAAALYAGDLLPGFDVRAPAYDAWLAAERQRLRRLALDVLDRLAGLREAAGDAERAAAAAGRLLALDPLHEPAHRRLMRIYAAQGRHADALRQYAACRAALRRELGVSPDAETERLQRELLERRREPAAASPAAPAPPSSAPPAPPRDELREVVVLVADVANFEALCRELDPEEASACLERYRDAVAESVSGQGGRAETRAGRAVAVFGHPRVRGDEADRALRSALALHTSAAELVHAGGMAPRLRIGVAAGSLWVRGHLNLGSLVGDAVASATALAERAPEGATLAAPDVLQALRGHARAEPAAGAWRILAVERAAPPRPIVGRDAELQQLDQLLARSAAGAGQALLVRGEAGIGKSRLAAELAERAAARGFRVAMAQVLDFGGRADPAPELLRALLAPARGESDTEAIERAAAEGRLTPAQVPFAYDLLDLPLPERLRPPFDALDNADRAAGRDALLPALAAADGGAPLLLLVEDVHWAAPEAMARLARAAAAIAGRPALLVMTTRPDDDPVNAAWRAAARGCSLTTLDLGPLSDTAAQELAAGYAGVDAGAAQECVHRAEGHPLFLDQLLRSAAAGGRVLPGSVRSIVLSRLDRLPEPERLAVQAASVLGQRFQAALLRHVLDDPGYAPARLLDEALLRAEGERLQFGHALIQEAVYSSLLRSRRQELHRRAAAWHAGRNPAARAEHLEAAGDASATDAYREAAADAHARYHYEDALRLADRGLALAGDRAGRASLGCLRADALRQLGAVELALSAYREALAASAAPAQRCRALIGTAHCLRLLDRYGEALEQLAAAEPLAAAADDAHALAEIYTLRGDLHFPQGKWDACLAAQQQALIHAERSGDPALQARALSGLGDAVYLEGRLLTARRLFERCIEVAREHGLARVESDNLVMLGAIDYMCLDTRASLEHCREAGELGEAIGNARAAMLAWDVGCVAHLYRGEAAEAEALALRALAISRRLGMRRFEAEQLVGQGEAAHMLGRQAEAEALLESAYRLAAETGLSYVGPWILGVVAKVTTSPERRHSALAEGEALLAAGCVSHCYLHFYQLAIEVALEDRRWDDAERLSAALEARFQAEPLPWTRFFAARGRALAAFGRGARDAGTLAALRKLAAEARQRELAPALAPIEAALRAA